MAKVLIIGSGGREHALGWKLAQSPQVEEVYCLGDNAGMATEPKMHQFSDLKYAKDKFTDIESLIRRLGVDLTFIGPEQPLVDGMGDYLRKQGRRVFGPSAAAAQLEADKFFSYDLMDLCRVPQAKSVKCSTAAEARNALEGAEWPTGVVLKARGLTGGKGVTVYDTKQQALDDLAQHAGAFGEQMLVANREHGWEFSIFGIADGNEVHPFTVAVQDHKRLNDGDQGPNTGGMGAYGPVRDVPPWLIRQIANQMLTPLVQYLRYRGTEYRGFLYAGMMMTDDGPKVLEFNVRMGDPECQPLMMLLQSDLYPLLSSAADGYLRGEMKFKPGAACCVVLAARGYPDPKKVKAESGESISGLEEAAQIPGVKVFHAGTKLDEQGRIVTSGGRVLGVTAHSSDGILVAQELAYMATNRISVPGGSHYRTDIGARAVGR